MIFRQMFDAESSTYTYLLAARPGAEALLIDPVRGQTEVYLELLDQLDVRLLHAVDTHTHADHIAALGARRDATQCSTLMGRQSRADCVSRYLDDDERITVDGLTLRAL